MIHIQRRTLTFLLVAGIIGLLTGCASRRTNSQFTVRVSGDISRQTYSGQCTVQKAGVKPGESVAQGLDVIGTVSPDGRPQEYETSGHFIYCAVAIESVPETITVELLQDGKEVASAQSTSPDQPAILEFGQKP